MPEPTASVDAYRFIKLATIRESVASVSTRNPDRRVFERNDFESAQEVWTSVSATGATPTSPDTVVCPMAPWVIVNQADDARRSFERLKLVSRRFLGRDLRLLGDVPRSDDVRDSVRNFLPVVEANPKSPAAMAFQSIAQKLDDELTRNSISRGAARASLAERSELPDLSAATSVPDNDGNRSRTQTKSPDSGR